MKKFLSLLSVSNISGTAVPTTIAVSSYQKKINSDINYQQTNNLENLNRIKKRENKLSFFVCSGLLKIIFYYDLGASDAAVFKGFVNDYTRIYNNNLILISSNKKNKYNNISTKIDVIKVFYSFYKSSDDDFDNNLQFLFKKEYCVSEGKVYEYNLDNDSKNIIIDSNDKNTKFKITVPPNHTIDNSKKFYIFSSKVILYEYETFVLIESYINDMKEHVKRWLYLQYKKQNPNFEIKQILNINLENLILSNVFYQKKQKNKIFNSEQNLESACKDSSSTFINNSNIEQIQYTISCSKQLTETNKFQKMNGFFKSNLTSETDNLSWNINNKVTARAGCSAGITFVGEEKNEVRYEYKWGGSKNYIITDYSNYDNTKIKTTTNTTATTVTAQLAKVPPHNKISISNKLWNNNIQFILNVFQKVNGNVSTDFIDENNNKTTVYTSIKDAMLNLSENKILPSKIKMNNDYSINFSYDIKSKKGIIMHHIEIGKAIPLQ
ncbi:hypothetical protein [Spiroplasma endosymbiont of Polydrusus formosus]|uniref:hypothetical protein n=1 Tax=Spiroplasma endosymbiont of Polydrusus formosus TaxID=3139326 RepID=UPI0035B54F62